MCKTGAVSEASLIGGILMKFGKKLERLLLAEMGVCLIVLLLSMSGRCSSMAILLSTLFQIFMIIYIIVVLVHPLQAYARILEHFY